MSDLTCARPPISSQETLGIFGALILSECESLASVNAVSKSAADKVAIENAS